MYIIGGQSEQFPSSNEQKNTMTRDNKQASHTGCS